MANDTPQFYIATDDGYAIIDEAHYHFSKEVTTIDAGHPLLKSNPAAWRPFTPTYTKASHDEWKRQSRSSKRPEPVAAE